MSTSLNNFFDQANNRVQANVQSLLTRAPYIQADLHSGRYFGPDSTSGIYRTVLVSPTKNPNPDQGQISPAVAVEAFDNNEIKPLPGFTPIGYFTRVYETRRGKVLAVQFETEGVGAKSGYSLNIDAGGSTILGEIPTSYNYFEKTRDVTTAQFQTSLQSLDTQPGYAVWPDGFPPTNPKNFLPEYERENFTGRNEPKPFLRGGHHSGGSGTPYENEDPVYFSFEIIINGASSPLFNGEILNFMLEIGGNLKGKAGLGNAEIFNRKPIIDSFCYESLKFFKFSPLPYVENRSLLDGLFNDDPEKRELLDSLPRYDIYQTLMEKKHYVRKIEGLDALNERNTANKSSSFVKYGEDLIKLTFYEDVTLSTGTLLNLYKILGWSRLNGKAMIPDNLLKFDCEIIITEIRNIARVRSALSVELYNSERQTIQPGDEAANSQAAPPQPPAPNAEQISVANQAGPTSTREKVSLTYEASLDYPAKGLATVITFNNGASVQKDIFSMGSSGSNPLKPFKFVKAPVQGINVSGPFDDRNADAGLRKLEEEYDLLKEEAISRVKSIHDQLGIELTAPYADREALNASENGTGIISNNSSIKVKTTDFYFNGDDIIIAGPPPIDELKEADRIRKEAEFDAATAERIRQQDEAAKKEQDEKEMAELEALSDDFNAELEAEAKAKAAEEKAAEDASKKKGFGSSADQKFFEENPPPTDKANIEDFQKWMNSNADGQSFTYVSGSNVGKQATWKNTGEGPGKSADGITGNMTKGAWAKYGQTYLNSKKVAQNIQFTPPPPGSEIEDLEGLGAVNPQSTVEELPLLRQQALPVETLPRLQAQVQETRVPGPLLEDGSFAPPAPLVLTTPPISLNTGRTIKPPPKTSKYALQVVKENLSRYRYKLYQCQFHVPTLPHPTNIDLSVAPTTAYDAHTIDISFKHSEMSFERFDMKNFEDSALGFENGEGFGLANPGADHGKYFILYNGDEIPFNPESFDSDLNISKDSKGTPIIQKSAAEVKIVPLPSKFFEVDEPGVIDKFSRGVIQDPSSSADYPNSKDVLKDIKRDQRRAEFTQGISQAGKNLFSAAKRVALSEVQKLGNDQFRLLNDTLSKVKSAYGVGGISPPKNVYEGVDPTKADGFGKNSQTALQNAVKNFAGDIGSSFLGLL